MLGVCKESVRAVWCPVCDAAGGVQPGLSFISLWCQRPQITLAWETIRLCGGFYGALSKVADKVWPQRSWPVWLPYTHTNDLIHILLTTIHSNLPTPLVIPTKENMVIYMFVRPLSCCCSSTSCIRCIHPGCGWVCCMSNASVGLIYLHPMWTTG